MTMKLNFSNVLTSIVALFVLTVTSVMVGTDNPVLNNVDASITQSIQAIFGTPKMNYAGGLFNDVMTFLATYGDATPLVILTIILAIILAFKKYKFLAMWFLAVVSTGGIMGVLLKFKFHRTRPVGHLAIDDGFSFPSGHAVGSTLFFLTALIVLVPLLKKYWQRKFISIILVMIWLGILASRLYFSAHHLSDVVAGVSLGVLWVSVGVIAYATTAPWFQRYLFKNSLI